MNTLIYRKATWADTEAVASLHTENWRDAYRGILPDAYLDGPIVDERASLWRSRFSSPDADRRYVLLAMSPEKLVGFVCVLPDEEPQWGACLDNLHVLPKWTGGGLGRQLFSRAVRWVISMEPEWGIHLWVFEANLGARRFYDALGGEVVERRQKQILEGIEIPSLLYVWHHLQKLSNNLTRDSARE